MEAWNEMEMVTWELAMTSKRVADLEARRLTRPKNEEDLRRWLYRSGSGGEAV